MSDKTPEEQMFADWKAAVAEVAAEQSLMLVAQKAAAAHLSRRDNAQTLVELLHAAMECLARGGTVEEWKRLLEEATRHRALMDGTATKPKIKSFQ